VIVGFTISGERSVVRVSRVAIGRVVSGAGAAEGESCPDECGHSGRSLPEVRVLPILLT